MVPEFNVTANSRPTETAPSELPHSADLSSIVGPQRKYVSIDPAGYALQTLEASLNSRGIKTNTLFCSAGFQHPSLAILELDLKLAEIPRQRDRITVVRELLEHVDTNDAYRNYICTKIPFLVRHLPKTDLQEILKYSLSFKERKVQANLAHAVLLGAFFKGDSELITLVSERRARQLISLKHYELRELVAKALYMRSFRRLSFPKGLDRSVVQRSVPNPKEARLRVRERLYSMHGAIKRHLEVLERYPALAKCRTTREFRRQLRHALSYTAPYVSAPGKAPRTLLIRERMGKLVNLLAIKVPTELTYQVHFGRATGVRRASSRDWTVTDIKNAREALGRMPRGHLLAVPKLHRIAAYKVNCYGARSDVGTIWISDEYRKNHAFSREFSGANGAQLTMIHECGHALQLGKSESLELGISERDIKIDQRTGEILGPTNPFYDFRAFMALSGWFAVLEKPVRWMYKDTVVAIGSKLFWLNYPVDYNGRKLIFRLYEDQKMVRPGSGFGGVKKAKAIRILLAHSADASVRGNDYPDPFEWWAESFTEYTQELRRFRILCPEQCLYFHLMFRHYPESHEEIQQLYRDVERRGSERSLEFHSKRLSNLGEQSPDLARALPLLSQLSPADLNRVATYVQEVSAAAVQSAQEGEAERKKRAQEIGAESNNAPDRHEGNTPLVKSITGAASSPTDQSLSINATDGRQNADPPSSDCT